MIELPEPDDGPVYCVSLNTQYWTHISGMVMQGWKTHDLHDQFFNQVLHRLQQDIACPTVQQCDPPGTHYGALTFAGTQFDLWNVLRGTVTSNGIEAVKYNVSGNLWAWSVYASFNVPANIVLTEYDWSVRDDPDQIGFTGGTYRAASIESLYRGQACYERHTGGGTHRMYGYFHDMVDWYGQGVKSLMLTVSLTSGMEINPDLLVGTPDLFCVQTVSASYVY